MCQNTSLHSCVFLFTFSRFGKKWVYSGTRSCRLSRFSRRKRSSSCARNGSLNSSAGNRPNTSFHTTSQSTAAISPEQVQVQVGVTTPPYLALCAVKGSWKWGTWAHHDWGRTERWAAGLWQMTDLSWADRRAPWCTGRFGRPAMGLLHTHSPVYTQPPPDTERGHWC